MLLIPTAVEWAAGTLPARATPVTWIWLALVLALFLVNHVVVADHHLHLGLIPSQVFAGVTFVVATWSLYADPALFDLWQLWTHLLVHPRFWELAVEIVLMLVLGRVLERLLGSAWFLAVLLSLGPLGGVALVLIGGETVHAGGLPLMLALLGVCLGRMPGAVTSWGLAWWAIVAVGWWPLFRLPLHTLGFLLVVLVLATTPSGQVPIELLLSLALLAIGIALGVLLRHHQDASAGGPTSS